MMGLSLSSEDYDSVGGLIIGVLDHVPTAGESITEDGIRFIVETMDKNRIAWVKMYLPEPTDEEDSADTQENSHK